jgi:carbonic anhydrase
LLQQNERLSRIRKLETRSIVSEILSEVSKANREYARNFGAKGELTMAPRKRFAVLTCMDARLDPAKFLGLGEGDAHVIRNAGGRATEDAIQSLAVSHWLMGTETWLVIHHTSCGMFSLTEEQIRAKLEEQGGLANEENFLGLFVKGDPGRSVITDIERLRTHPWTPPSVQIHGFLYDVKTGELHNVA